jgi:hypothetical protein
MSPRLSDRDIWKVGESFMEDLELASHPRVRYTGAILSTRTKEIEDKRMTHITPILSRERAGGSGESLPTCLWYKKSFDMCFRHFYQLDVEVRLTVSDVDPANYACVVLEVFF